MKRFLSSTTTLARCEFVVAIVLTLALIGFHIVFMFHAGPLWRDEISSLTLATKPTLSESWHSLKFDPFPAFYFFLLRGWNAVGFGHSDLGLRFLGLLIGVSLIVALWIASYLSDESPPLWPLALCALNPLTLEAGDSLRPYGIGLIWIVLAFGFVARILFGGPTKTIGLCTLFAAVLSVQSNFTNALMFFSIGTGAIVVLLTKRAWSKIFIILGIGAVAAISLIPYLPILSGTSDWSKILAGKNDIASVSSVARDAIANSGAVAEWTWLTLICAIIIFAIFVTLIRNPSAADFLRDRSIFGAIVLVLAAASMVGFLCAAKYLVFPRYFLAVPAIGALCINIFWNAIPNQIAIRTLGFCLALIVAITSLRPLSERARMRMTNCDEITATLEQRATASDFIIVTSPLYGISFQRYYHGQTNWTTLPPIGDLTLHRWDLVKQAMTQPDPVPELVSRAQIVLQGHKVFLVGKLGPAPATEHEPLAPAPQSQFAWQMEAYTGQWKSELTYWFEHHALHGTNLPVDENALVSPLEQLGLFEISGLREP
ncbi:MAG TPA: hypothetical protein VLK27_12285 [Chthoniobacterales bacterium]|nr:hypothetical protein [Chthoniobacterales bacterium]